jgi:signal transduction histidine kinase
MLTPKANEGMVTLSYLGEPPCPPLFGEERAIKQVIINLLTNAIKFTPKDGTVELRVDRSDPNSLKIVVRDSGSGIAPEILPRLGQPFMQAEDVHARRHGGVGLGLAISKRLMELHGGRLEIDSELGAGTKVSAILPASRQRAIDPAGSISRAPVEG